MIMQFPPLCQRHAELQIRNSALMKINGSSGPKSFRCFSIFNLGLNTLEYDFYNYLLLSSAPAEINCCFPLTSGGTELGHC